MFQEKVKILHNDNLAKDYFRIALECPDFIKNAVPGQFVMLKVSDNETPLLRRPFSIHNLILQNNKRIGLEVLYKVVGKGTKLLSKFKTNEYVNIIGPLGKGFEINLNHKNICIIAGGIGVAPMLFLASKIGPTIQNCTVLIGGRNKDDILCKNEFTNLGFMPEITTDDGSLGQKGFVTNALIEIIKDNNPDIIYACGPNLMLKAVAEISNKFNIECQISMESHMACGIGACLGCAVPNKKNPESFLHVCSQGPVFNAQDILFYD